GTTVRLSAASSTDSDGAVVSYRWQIDGGITIGTVSNFLDIGNLTVGRHTISLVVVDDNGESSPAVSQDVSVIDGVVPTAVLRAPPVIIDGAAAALGASESTDVGGQIVEYRYTVDGAVTVRTEPTFSVTGLKIGNHIVSLVVVDNAGNVSAADTKVISVVARGVAVLDVPATLSFASPSLVLRADRSTSGTPLVRYSWTLRGETFETPTPTLTRPVPPIGRHDVTLRVVDDQGNESAAATASVVVIDDRPPTAVITGPASVANGASIKLGGSTSTDVGGRIVEYRWTVGTRAPVVTSTSTFTAPGFTAGPVKATLVVVDDAGNQSPSSTIIVGVLPKEPVIGTFPLKGSPTPVQLIAPIGKRVGQVSRGKRTLLAGRIFSPTAARVSATFSLRRSGRSVSLARRTISVDEGGVVRLETKLSATALRQLAGLRTAKLRMRLSVRPPGAAKAEVITRDVSFAITP
ncbi:MAG: hypothetical protein JHD16_19070, partial [Solirubrobacteraceae bacterium]|nr:hypothetical protein [Solirubrobacteraceae bacterium]